MNYLNMLKEKYMFDCFMHTLIEIWMDAMSHSRYIGNRDVMESALLDLQCICFISIDIDFSIQFKQI